jgi:hypothetical protein
MDDLTPDGLIVNFSWGREEIQPSDNGALQIARPSGRAWNGLLRS